MRTLAKTVFWAACGLSHVRTPQKVRQVVSQDPLVTVPAGRKWVPCRMSFRLLNLSVLLDWEHWDHWARQHNGCNALLCPECGGGICGWEEEEDDAA